MRYFEPLGQGDGEEEGKSEPTKRCYASGAVPEQHSQWPQLPQLPQLPQWRNQKAHPCPQIEASPQRDDASAARARADEGA